MLIILLIILISVMIFLLLFYLIILEDKLKIYNKNNWADLVPPEIIKGWANSFKWYDSF